jgi:hypothetical protein
LLRGFEGTRSSARAAHQGCFDASTLRGNRSVSVSHVGTLVGAFKRDPRQHRVVDLCCRSDCVSSARSERGFEVWQRWEYSTVGSSDSGRSPTAHVVFEDRFYDLRLSFR